MRTDLWQRLDYWARRGLPACLSVLLVLIGVLPIPVPGYSSIVPMLPLAAVFFWAVHDPRLLPPVAVFAIGLLNDALSGAPMGATAVVLLVVYGTTLYQRRFFHNRSFAQVWVGFALVAFGAAVVSWLVAMLVSGMFMPPRAAVFQYLLTIAVYPLVTWMLHGAQQLIPAES